MISPPVVKLMTQGLVETVTRCTYLDKSSLCMVGVGRCLYNDLKKEAFSLQVPPLSTPIPRSGGPTQPRGALWGFSSYLPQYKTVSANIKPAVLWGKTKSVKESSCTCTEDLAAAAHDSIFLPGGFGRHRQGIALWVMLRTHFQAGFILSWFMFFCCCFFSVVDGAFWCSCGPKYVCLPSSMDAKCAQVVWSHQSATSHPTEKM